MEHKKCALRLDGKEEMSQFSERGRNLDSADHKVENLILILKNNFEMDCHYEPVDRQEVLS